MGALWFHLDVPRHRTHFTQGSLRTACETAGFSAIDVRTAVDPGALAATLQYRFFDRIVAPPGWPTVAFQAATTALAPMARALDRAAGESDVLTLTAKRTG